MLHSLISFAYALGSFFRVNPCDITYNQELGISKKNGTLRNMKLARNAPALSTFLSYAQINSFLNEDGSLNMSKIHSPQFSGNDQDEVWAYYFDEDFIKNNFRIYPIFGKYGKADNQQEGFVAALLIANQPSIYPHILSFKGTQGGVGLASVLAAYFGKSNNAEWASNMNRSLKQSNYFPGRVHNGFLQIFMSIKEKLDSLIATHIKSGELYVCGHSLGAALALLTGYLALPTKRMIILYHF
jgi:hypothetical protein